MLKTRSSPFLAVNNKVIYPRFARTVPDSMGEATAIVKYFCNEVNTRHLVVPHEQQDYGITMSSSIVSAATEICPEMSIFPLSIPEDFNDLDVKNAATAIKNSEFKHVFYIGSQDSLQPLLERGVKEGIAYFGIDLSHHEDPYQAHPHIDNNGTFEDLRAVGPSLEQHEGSILAHARGLMFWHKRNGYCGVCGAETQPEKAGSQRRCTNVDCNTEHFPRTDPAVIMLVYKGDTCLLGRTRNFIPQMYSTLAGFVEPAESLEEAVA